MPVEAILILIAVAVLANVALMGAALSPSVRRWTDGDEPAAEPTGVSTVRARPREGVLESGGEDEGATAVAGAPASTVTRRETDTIIDPSISPATFDRVVRVVAWIFLLSTTIVVAVTGLWPTNQAAILVLLALAGLFVLVIHDLLPPEALGGAKFLVEGSVAITLAALLVLLTGQGDSPFFFAFPLIVGGAALVVSPRATVALAAAASIAYVTAVGVGRDDPFSPVTVATVGINLTALLLLAYVGMVIAQEQRRSRDEAVRLSTIDPLTGLHTRAYFFTALEREINRSTRTGRRFCLLMMDLDELKAINDRLGHYHGDRALRAVGEVIRAGVRKIDTAARFGGDEFVVLLPETDPTGAWVLAEKIRMGASDVALDAGSERIRTTLSVGVVSHPDDGATPDELMIAADAAMYASKRAGKDRVMGVPVGGHDAPGTAAEGGQVGRPV